MKKLYSKIDAEGLVGQRFGKLVVQELVSYKNNKYYYRCGCDCGGETIAHRGRLLSGAKTHCGCEGNKRPDPEALIGRRFGRMTVVSDLGTRGEKYHKKRYYRCICDCGKEFETAGARILNGEVTSCGDCVSIVREDDHYRYFCIDGDSFIFDSCDLELVKSYRWYISNGYPVTRSGGGRYQKLSRMIFGLGPDDKNDIDHIDGNPRNNLHENMRFSEHKHNMWNRKIPSNNTTGYKGVPYSGRKKPYLAQISVDGKYKFLGYFDTPEEAARAYDKAARFYFGEFACVNFPLPGERGCRQNLEETQVAI